MNAIGLRPAALLAGTLLAAAAAGGPRAADQPQWGERFSRNMVSPERDLPDSFDPKTGKNVAWSVQLGTETHSTPIIAGGRVYIGTNNGEPRDPKHQGDRGVLMCFAEKDGRFLWQLVVPKREDDPYLDWPNSGIASPATVEGDRVYIVSNRGEVMCLDAQGMANGNDGPFRDEGRHMTPRGAALLEPGPTDADILWLFDLVSGAGIYSHDAAHSSILVVGPYLYLNTGTGVDNTHRRIRTPNAPSLVVLDKATGRLVARDQEQIAPRIFHSTWASPALGVVHGRPLIFFAGGDGVVYAFETVPTNPPPGEVLSLKKVWQFDFDPTGPKGDVHPFLTNRREGPSNIYGMPVFAEDRLFVAGGGDVFWGKTQAWLKCVDPTGTGDITQSGLVWSCPLSRHTLSTAAVCDGLVFVSDCGHEVHCIDARTGQPNWALQTRGEMWASPLVADGKVYLGTRSGDFWVLAASKEKKVLSTIDLGSPISATVTAANRTLYIATMTHLYAVRKKAE